jgi:hypothetical protein
MTMTALILAGLALIVALVALAAAAELLNSLKELEDHVGYVDHPTSLTELTGRLFGRRPSEFGLPTAADVGRMVLFLTPKCLTCYKVASAFRGRVPEGLTVVVTGEGPKLYEWIEEVGLTPDKVVLDEGGGIATRASIDASPVGLVVQEHTVVHAYTVPSHRALEELLDEASRRTLKIVKGG